MSEEQLAVRETLAGVRRALAQQIQEINQQIAELDRQRGVGLPTVDVEVREVADVEPSVDRARLPYIDAGVRLIAKAFGFTRLRGDRTMDRTEPIELGLWEFLTPARINAEVSGERAPSAFFGLWPKRRRDAEPGTPAGRDRYALDLIQYLLGQPDLDEKYWEPGELAAHIRPALDGQTSVSAAIHALAAENVSRSLSDPLWYLGHSALALTFREDETGAIIRGCLSKHQRLVLDRFAPDYMAMLEAFGLELRRGLDEQDFASVIAALARGFASQHAAEGTIPASTQNRFGAAILAVVIGLTVPKGASTNVPVEAAADEHVRRAEVTAGE